MKITEARRKHIHKETHDEKFENVSTMNLKQIWDEMEHFMDTRETDKLADVMVTIDAPPKKKEKKEKPKVIPTRVTYDIWGEYEHLSILSQTNVFSSGKSSLTKSIVI